METVLTGADPRTWAEKYAPLAAADLAVHPRKVADVRNWLDQVLSNFSRKVRRLIERVYIHHG